MPNTLSLLAMTQEQAFAAMVSEHLVAGVNLDDLTIWPGHLQSGNRSSATVTVAEHRQSDPDWVYYGSVVYSHQRMSLNTFFQGLTVRVKMPANDQGGITTTSNALVDLLSDIFNIRFSPQDYYSDEITAPGKATYQLRATPNSLRWTGMVTVEIYPDEEAGT